LVRKIFRETKLIWGDKCINLQYFKINFKKFGGTFVLPPMYVVPPLASSLLFIGFGNPKSSKNGFCGTCVRTGDLGRPDGPSFSCPKSNSGIFYRAILTGKCLRPDGTCPNTSNGRPYIQFTEIFLRFPTTPISSQSDI